MLNQKNRKRKATEAIEPPQYDDRIEVGLVTRSQLIGHSVKVVVWNPCQVFGLSLVRPNFLVSKKKGDGHESRSLFPCSRHRQERPTK